jgi:hypothetical protein
MSKAARHHYAPVETRRVADNLCIVPVRPD